MAAAFLEMLTISQHFKPFFLFKSKILTSDQHFSSISHEIVDRRKNC